MAIMYEIGNMDPRTEEEDDDSALQNLGAHIS